MAKYLKPGVASLKPSTFHKLTLADVMCPICHEIFIKPVTLPCFHGFCLQCFERTVQENALTCPLCRKRIGSWLRTVSKDRNLVNQRLWELVQEKFPDQVKAKLCGDDDGVEQVVVGNSVAERQFSSPGAIKLEFEEHLRKLEEEARKRAEREEQESANLIRQLQEEEERQLEERRQQLLAQEQLDEQLARQLLENSEKNDDAINHRPETRNHAYSSYHQNSKSSRHSVDGLYNNHLNNSQKIFKSKQHSKNSSHLSKALQSAEDRKNNVYNDFRNSQRGPMDAYVVPKRPIHESLLDDDIDLELVSVNRTNKLEAGRRHLLSDSSHDSIDPEIHHFKPIRAMPLTPPKMLSDGSKLVVRLVRSVPVNLNDVYNSRSDTYTSSTISRQLKAIQLDRISSAPTCSKNSFFTGVSGVKNVSSAFTGTGITMLRRKAETCLANSTLHSLRKRRHSESSDDESESSKSRRTNSVASVKSETFSYDDTRSSKDEDDVEEHALSSSSKVRNDEEDVTFTKEQWDECCDLLNDLPDFEDDNKVDDKDEKGNKSSREETKSVPQSSQKTDVNNVEPSCSTEIELESNISSKIFNNIEKMEDSEFSQEQRRLEELFKQEQADYEYALKLSRELNTIDRRKGSSRAYELRSTNRQASGKRQRKLEEYAGTSFTKH